MEHILCAGSVVLSLMESGFKKAAPTVVVDMEFSTASPKYSTKTAVCKMHILHTHIFYHR